MFARKAVALYPLSSPNHNDLLIWSDTRGVALYPLSSPNHNSVQMLMLQNGVALYPLSSPNHNMFYRNGNLYFVALYPLSSPNHNLYVMTFVNLLSCVISSFITKPQPFPVDASSDVVLRYILFHHQTTTCSTSRFCRFCVALYPLSSPNHNSSDKLLICLTLRYILFHHQTTTFLMLNNPLFSCVISSFITKPQPPATVSGSSVVALYPLSSPNHNCRG